MAAPPASSTDTMSTPGYHPIRPAAALDRDPALPLLRIRQVHALGRLHDSLCRIAQSERGYCRLSPLRFEWPHSDPGSSLTHWDSDQHTTRDNEDLPMWHWGQVILQPWSGSQLCPVQAMRKYHAIRHATPTTSPLFIFRSGQYFTVKDVNYWMTRALGPGVSSHSLRIGGATAMAGRNASAWQLQKAGRWASDMYKTYLRVPAGLPIV